MLRLFRPPVNQSGCSLLNWKPPPREREREAIATYYIYSLCNAVFYKEIWGKERYIYIYIWLNWLVCTRALFLSFSSAVFIMMIIIFPFCPLNNTNALFFLWQHTLIALRWGRAKTRNFSVPTTLIMARRNFTIRLSGEIVNLMPIRLGVCGAHTWAQLHLKPTRKREWKLARDNYRNAETKEFPSLLHFVSYTEIYISHYSGHVCRRSLSFDPLRNE